MSEHLKNKAKFISGYQSSLMVRAVKGRDLPGDSPNNFYNTRKSGDEYEAWSAIERIGLASKKEFNELYWNFKLTKEGLELTNYLICLTQEISDIPFLD